MDWLKKYWPIIAFILGGSGTGAKVVFDELLEGAKAKGYNEAKNDI